MEKKEKPEKKERRERKWERKPSDKKESKIITKESICATCALFSVFALFVLCTRTLVFGDVVGLTVHSLLTGAFGYMAYPLTIGALYASVMGLFGKRLVKNRKIGTFIVLFCVSAALIVHTALTLTELEQGNYLQYCFFAGETFPNTTVCGWFGGLLVYGLAVITTGWGALIFFSLLTVFFGYICVMLIRRSILAKKAAGTVDGATENAVEIPLTQPQQNGVYSQQIPLQKPDANAAAGSQSVYQQPTYQSVENQQTQMHPREVRVENGRNAYGAYMPEVNQRPGVSLSEENGQASQSSPDARVFSPFGMQQNGQGADSVEYSYENSRAFLFGSTPAENYRKNLIFDPNSSVNRRPNVSPDHPTIGNGYTPSYTEAYQNSMNENTDARPLKIVNDQSNNYNGYTDQNNGYGSYTQQSPIEPIPASELTPIQPIEPPLEPRETLSYPSLDEQPSERSRGLDYTELATERETPTFEREETRGVEPAVEDMGRDESGYRRHDYMDLFSPSNPNLFGGNEEDTRGGFDDTRSVEDTDSRSVRGGRDGLNLFDEPEEDLYSLRSEFDVRGTDRGDFSARSETPDILETPRMGFGREETESRGRGIDAELDDDILDTRATRSAIEATPVQPVEPPKPIPPKPRVIRPYVRVPLDDFDCRDIEPTANQMEVEETKANIIATLEEFKVTGASIASVTFGPTVTRYNVTIPRSISPKKVVALDQSIAISLHSSGVNIYPNYEDGVVSIEVPNKERQFVQLGCMLSGDTFVNAKSSSLMFAMGKDVANRKVYGDISKMIHLLVAGSSGSGKSVFLGSLIVSLIYKYSPEELRLILIDPKKTEFVLYNNLPHLMIDEIITDANKAVQSLNWAIGEMNRRYGLFEQMSRAGTYVVNLDQYNAQIEKEKRLPKIVIIIDELADLMLAAKKEMEDRIQNLTQKARAAGIHLIVATQRPSTDVITGVIKSNLPTRIAFYVATDVDSRVILDQTGAQKLLGKGDFLYTMPGLASPVRVQSAFISPEDSQKVVNFIKNNNEAYFDEEATAFINSRGGYAGDDSGAGGADKGSVDPMYIDALRYVILSGSASISMIQRKCSAGYNRAGKIIEWMEDMGYISPFDGAKARKVLITKEEFESKYGPLQ